MGNVLNWKEVLNQSNAVFSQFGKSKWIPYAHFNKYFPRKDSRAFEKTGLGKFLVFAAMGESLEANIDVLKKYRDRVDICTCDKGFRPLLEHGIKADYVMLCDCNVPFDYIGDAIDATDNVILIATPYANPKWVYHWKGDRYFFVSQDAIETEKIFFDIFGRDMVMIPAGSNVSNTMLIFFARCDEFNKYNYAAYERYILLGYDYSWRRDGNYYSWINPKPKRYYMNHRTVLDYKGDACFTSENLWFSARWMYSYITTFNLPVVNCSDRGVLDIPHKNTLEKELSNINPNKYAIAQLKASYESLALSHMAVDNNKKMFELNRGGLYVNR